MISTDKPKPTRTFAFRLSLMTRMLMALIYDIILTFAFIIVVFMPIGTIEYFSNIGDNIYFEAFKTILLLMTLIVYFVISIQKLGQTIGMKAWRLKLIFIKNNQPIAYPIGFIKAFTHCCLSLCLSPFFLSILVSKYAQSIANKLDKSYIDILPKLKFAQRHHETN